MRFLMYVADFCLRCKVTHFLWKNALLFNKKFQKLSKNLFEAYFAGFNIANHSIEVSLLV